ncbi:MAG: DinB family protein [Chloroflexota bacterium]
MLKDYLVQLYDYTDWANRRVWECVAKVEDDVYFADRDFSVGSLYDQLLHTMGVELWWLSYLDTGNIIFLTEDEVKAYEDRKVFRQRWDDVARKNKVYLANLTPDELQRKVHPDFWDDDEPSITVAQAIIQVTQHSLDHRAQTMTLLHQLGYEGTNQDFLTFLHEQKK